MNGKALELSAKSSILFKDIDLKKAKETLNREFYIHPPSNILVLKNILTIEEVKLSAAY